MIALVFSDLEERILPDEFTLGGTALGVIFAAFVPVSGGILLLIFYSSKNQWLVSVATRCWPPPFAPAHYGLVRALYEKVRTAKGWDWAM
jgi:prepilin signal peptidase PulO-like enzyme (type II secretory pathway)